MILFLVSFFLLVNWKYTLERFLTKTKITKRRIFWTVKSKAVHTPSLPFGRTIHSRPHPASRPILPGHMYFEQHILGLLKKCLFSSTARILHLAGQVCRGAWTVPLHCILVRRRVRSTLEWSVGAAGHVPWPWPHPCRGLCRVSHRPLSLRPASPQYCGCTVWPVSW